MNTASYEWAARVRALNEIEVAKAMAAHAVRVPLSASAGGAGDVNHGFSRMSFADARSVFCQALAQTIRVIRG